MDIWLMQRCFRIIELDAGCHNGLDALVTAKVQQGGMEDDPKTNNDRKCDRVDTRHALVWHIVNQGEDGHQCRAAEWGDGEQDGSPPADPWKHPRLFRVLEFENQIRDDERHDPGEIS